ncbi:MAG TPA: ATP-binding protein [Vicinamibacterales bacterium]|nr:ATP-binding protein [Vicinamibacterales bacterium]
MRRWLDRQPIHRKLVAIALLVTTAALVLATVGLAVLDLWRFRATAVTDTTALARVIAENTAAAVLFSDPEDARQTLEALRVRPGIRRACVYLNDGRVFAEFSRSADLACPDRMPLTLPYPIVAGSAAITRGERIHGTVYVERDLPEIRSRVGVALISGALMLLLAGAVALLIANRLHRTVSAPIAQLAASVRALDPEGPPQALPPVPTGVDEVGDLGRAFIEVLRRVREANDALRLKEMELEDLLVREREASRLKDEFLAAVSHELRTPLNAILGWVQILSTTTTSEQTTARALASIARNAMSQTRVIEDLVDVSRIATGKLNLRHDPVDLREAVDAAVEVIRPAAQAKDVAFHIHQPNDACLVNGDRDRLQQVVWNLLSNAVKFTPSGGSISLVTRVRGPVYEIEVKDTGAGIPADFLPYVFDRFRQADGSMTREHGGLGLGLAIVKELTELHLGSVTVASDGPGSGATFRVRVPALIGFESAPSRPAGTETATQSLEGVRVLAVDDNADSLEVLSVALTAAGARVRTAASGAAALEAWSREPADVLVCDLAMPEMDGFDVLRRIRELDRTAGRTTPAIAVSAHATAEHLARSLRAGFAQHLVKPFRAGDLVRAVSDAVMRLC